MAADRDAATFVEELRRHESELRPLVRALLRGRGDAEDVLQEVWLRALQRPPREPAAALVYLRTIARRVVIDWRRKDSARERREREVTARSAAEPAAAELSAAETVERLQTCAIVTQAVVDLPDTLREAVVLRYLHGHDVAKIAADLGVSAANVRQRIHRGVVELRRRLAARYGGGDAWRRSPALLAIAGLRPAAATVPFGTLLGVVLGMGKTGLVSSVLVVLLLIGAALASWTAWAPSSQPPAAPVERTVAERVATAGAGGVHTVADGAAPARSAIDSPAAVTPPAPGPTGLVARVRVVDGASGAPVPAARVAALPDGLDWPSLDASAQAAVDRFGGDDFALYARFGSVLTADADGLVEVPVGESLLLCSEHGDLAGSLTIRGAELIAGRTLTLRLAPDPRAEVRVVDERSGAPVEGVHLYLLPAWKEPRWAALRSNARALRGHWLIGVTDRDGRVALRGLGTRIGEDTARFPIAPDGVRIEVAMPGLDAPPGVDLWLDAWPVGPVRLPVPPTAAVVVRCVDAAGRAWQDSGEGQVELRALGPAGGEAGASGWEYLGALPLGPGRCEFRCVAVRGPRCEVRLDDGRAGVAPHVVFDAPPAGGRCEVELPIPAGAVSLTGRLVDVRGRPLPGLLARLGTDCGAPFDLARFVTSADGRFRLELEADAIGSRFCDVRCGQVERHRDGRLWGRLPDLGELGAGEHELGDVVMAELPLLAVVDVTVGGEPPRALPSVLLTHYVPEEDDWQLAGAGMARHVAMEGAGRFVVRAADDGRRWGALVTAPDAARVRSVEFVRRGDELTVDLEPGAAVEVFATVPAGARAALSAQLVDAGGRPMRPAIEGVDPDDALARWRGLPAGDYELRVGLGAARWPLRAIPLTLGPDRPPWQRVDVDLRAALRPLDVTVVAPAGSPPVAGVAGWRIGSMAVATDDRLQPLTPGGDRLWVPAQPFDGQLVVIVPGFEPAVRALPPPAVESLRIVLFPEPPPAPSRSAR